jgi:hypothetical protein
LPHKIRVLESDVVEIVHTGDLTITEATASRNEAVEMMKELSRHLVLADVSRSKIDESTLDLLSFNASHYEVFPADTRIAVVTPPDPGKAASARFAETVAFNRGIAMRIFSTSGEAMNWLLEPDRD